MWKRRSSGGSGPSASAGASSPRTAATASSTRARRRSRSRRTSWRKANLPDGFVAHDPAGPPAALEIALVDDDVPAAHARALEAGARELAGPKQKPWGQTVSYVRDPNGVLVELCTPIA